MDSQDGCNELSALLMTQGRGTIGWSRDIQCERLGDAQCIPLHALKGLSISYKADAVPHTSYP